MTKLVIVLVAAIAILTVLSAAHAQTSAVTIIQEGNPFPLPGQGFQSQTFSHEGGAGGFEIQSSGSWNAVSTEPSWLVIQQGAGNGNGPVRYSVAANNAGPPRRAEIIVGDKRFAVRQLGAYPFQTTFDVASNAPVTSPFFRNGVPVWPPNNGGTTPGRGIAIGVVNPRTGAIERARRFDTYQFPAQLADVADYLNAIQDGEILLFSVGDEAQLYSAAPLPSEVRRILREDFGSGFIGRAEWRSSHAIIAVKQRGNGFLLAEGFGTYLFNVGWEQTFACFSFNKVNTAVAVSAATYLDAVAADSILAIYGQELASGNPGTEAKVHFASGRVTFDNAKAFFLSPGQVNCHLHLAFHPRLRADNVTFRVHSDEGKLSIGKLKALAVAPGIFTANGDGKGVPAALTLRIGGGYDSVAHFDPILQKYVPKPIDLGQPNDQTYLILYATGSKWITSVSELSVTIGGVACPIQFIGAAPGFVGLDQINVFLPRTLIGRGEVDVVMTVSGQTANTVQIAFK